MLGAIPWYVSVVATTAIAILDPRGAAADQEGLHWLVARGGEVPPGAIVGGWEPRRTLYVCRAFYKGWHFGKLVDSTCKIGYGGGELTVTTYELLVGGNSKTSWVDASASGMPPSAFGIELEEPKPLYLCRAYHRGYHPGTIVGPNCNIGYGGDELAINLYKVLVPGP
jgi:hypothetical protein